MAAEAKAGKPKASAGAAPDAKVDAMRDLRMALESKDDEAAALAFERAYGICADHSEEPEEDEGGYELGD
jgi:hypothetical protein